jgi:hypothetical protein
MDQGGVMSKRNQNPTSEKGWPVTDYDKNLWIPCPPGFPVDIGRQGWATAYARAWWDAAMPGHGDSAVQLLAGALIMIYEGTYGHVPAHLVWIHLPNPTMLPLPVYVSAWRSEGDRDDQLGMLAGSRAPCLVEPPIIEEFAAEKLGSGLRAMRYQHADDGGSVYATISYAWRSDTFETDLQIWSTSDDIGRLHLAIPDIERFAHDTTIVERDSVPEGEPLVRPET